ncbi:MAG: GNAT family N-acetyltransferase [Treponema sp.]|jgi:GNAT superfamily N-acetyltransferase|nr:GNAT family N-acetyltransferase [Treponema sp.]
MTYCTANKHTRLRFAEEEDIPLILEFIRGLAEYEHLLDQVIATEESIGRYVFREKMVEVIIAEYDNVPAGFALFFHNFSTFLGKPGIFVEDIFVKPELRSKGIGKALLSFIARIGLERDIGRLEWNCLEWNESSKQFYKSLGARQMQEWTIFRVTGGAVKNLAETVLVTPVDREKTLYEK